MEGPFYTQWRKNSSFTVAPKYKVFSSPHPFFSQTNGAEKRSNGAEKRKCTLGPPYSLCSCHGSVSEDLALFCSTDIQRSSSEIETKTV